MSLIKITEKESTEQVKNTASVLITQPEDIDGSEIESLRRASLAEFVTTLKSNGFIANDPSLSISGAFADAKAVGDALALAIQPGITITTSNCASYPDANSLTPNRTYGIQSGITSDQVKNLPSYGSTGFLMYYTASTSAKNGVQFFHNATESWYRTVNGKGEGTWVRCVTGDVIKPETTLDENTCKNYPDANAFTPNRTYCILASITSNQVQNLPSYGSTGYLMYYTASASIKNGVQFYHNAAESWYRTVNSSGVGTWIQLGAKKILDRTLQIEITITTSNCDRYPDANAFTPNRTYGIQSSITSDQVKNLPSYGSTGYLMYYTASDSAKNGVQLYQNGTESWYRTVNSSGSGTWRQLAFQTSLDQMMQPARTISPSNCASYPDANSLTPNRTYGIQSGITSDMVANLPAYGSTGFLMYHTASPSEKNGVQLYHNETESWYRTVDSSGAGTWVKISTGDSLKPEVTIDSTTSQTYSDANSFPPNRTYCILASITSNQVQNLPSYGSTGYLMYYTASASIKNGVQLYHNKTQSWYRTVNSSGAGTWVQLADKVTLNRTIQSYITITLSNYTDYPDANNFTPNRTYGIQSGITSDMVANLPSYGSTGYLMYYTSSDSAKNGVQLYHNETESWYRTVNSSGAGTWVKMETTTNHNPNIDIKNYFVSTCIDKPIDLQSGKGLFIFGDSITTNSHGRLTWGSIIADKTGCTEYNYGVGSAAFVPSEERPDLKIMTQIEGVPSDNWVNCDVCIVAAGTNDSNYHTTAKALRSEVQNVITTIKAKAPNAKIIFITPIRRADSTVRLSQLPAIAGAICNMALINGCSVINGFDFPIPTYSDDWIENLTSDSTGLPVSDEHPGDGLHPGIVGKRIYAQCVLNALQ